MSARLPRLFVHAFGAAGRSWDGVRAASPGEALSPDVPGFGGAPPFAAPSISAYADWLSAQAPTGPHLLVGWSMGGKLALALAARRPANLRALVLVCPSPPGPEPMAPGERTAQAAAWGDRAEAETSIATLAGAPLAPDVGARAVQDRLAASQAAWRWWMEAGSGEALDVSAVDVPILLVAGGADPHLGPDVQRKHTLPHLPGATLEVVAGAGHLLPLERPAELAALIEAFAPAR